LNCRQKYAEKTRVDKSAGGIQAGSSLASLGKQVFKSAPLKELENILIVAISRIIPHSPSDVLFGSFLALFSFRIWHSRRRKNVVKGIAFLTL